MYYDIVQPNHHTHQLHVLCDDLLRIWPSFHSSCAILDISSHDHETAENTTKTDPQNGRERYLLLVYSVSHPPWPLILPLGEHGDRFGANGAVSIPIFVSSGWPGWKVKIVKSTESPTHFNPPALTTVAARNISPSNTPHAPHTSPPYVGLATLLSSSRFG